MFKGRICSAEGQAGAVDLEWESSWYVREAARGPVWLGGREEWGRLVGEEERGGQIV